MCNAAQQCNGCFGTRAFCVRHIHSHQQFVSATLSFIIIIIIITMRILVFIKTLFLPQPKRLLRSTKEKKNKLTWSQLSKFPISQWNNKWKTQRKIALSTFYIRTESTRKYCKLNQDPRVWTICLNCNKNSKIVGTLCWVSDWLHSIEWVISSSTYFSVAFLYCMRMELLRKHTHKLTSLLWIARKSGGNVHYILWTEFSMRARLKTENHLKSNWNGITQNMKAIFRLANECDGATWIRRGLPANEWRGKNTSNTTRWQIAMSKANWLENVMRNLCFFFSLSN